MACFGGGMDNEKWRTCWRTQIAARSSRQDIGEAYQLNGFDLEDSVEAAGFSISLSLSA